MRVMEEHAGTDVRCNTEISNKRRRRLRLATPDVQVNILAPNREWSTSPEFHSVEQIWNLGCSRAFGFRREAVRSTRKVLNCCISVVSVTLVRIQ